MKTKNKQNNDCCKKNLQNIDSFGCSLRKICLYKLEEKSKYKQIEKCNCPCNGFLAKVCVFPNKF